MWNQWKFFEKMNNHRNFHLFGGWKWQKSEPLRPISSTHLNVLAMRMWSNTDVKWLKNVSENYQRPEFLLVLGPKTAPKLGSELWGPYSTHLWNYLQCAILVWSQRKLFDKMTIDQNFYLLLGPKWPKTWAFKAHIVRILGSSSNEHIKQDWCESRGNFLTK